MNISKTKKLTTIGMLCALAYVAVVVGRIPLVLFLKYDHACCQPDRPGLIVIKGREPCIEVRRNGFILPDIIL